MQVDDGLRWLYGYNKYGSKLGLERITTLLKSLGNPHHSLQTIHVTGTNGKGSVSRFLGSILTHAGYRTGVYLSPHLEHFSERITINGNEISENDLIELIHYIQPFVVTLEDQGDAPTFFEIVTAMAFYYFHQQKVDYLVAEVGLGGRFDATNVIQPILSVITNISLEHTQYLGNDVTSVAFEKAGIIKPAVPVVTAAHHEALLVIEAIAKEKQAPVIKISCDMWKRSKWSLDFQEFQIKASLKDYQILTTILGKYQGENLAITLHAIEQLQIMGIYITEADILEGVAGTRNPGRMELLFQNPLFILDGAHNPAGMHMLATTFRNDFKFTRLILVIGILKDKNINQMLKSINDIADELIFTQSENPRACKPEILAQIASNTRFKGKKKIVTSIPDAVEQALNSANKSDAICVTGSLFTVGEARTYLLENKKHFSKSISKLSDS